MLTLNTIAVSSDGMSVAFQFCDDQQSKCGIGILNLKNDSLDVIPNPPGQQLLHPAFSNDKKQLVAVSACAIDCQGYDKYQTQIVFLDLATHQLKRVDHNERKYRAFPIFFPNSEKILAVATEITLIDGKPARLGLRGFNSIDLLKGSEDVLLVPEQGFKTYVNRPSFIGADEIVFDAIAPILLDGEVADLNLSMGKFAPAAFYLKFGSLPMLLPENISARRKSAKSSVPLPGLSNISASADGSRLVFVALSDIEPEQKSGAFNYEIFMKKESGIQRLTNLKTFIGEAQLSSNGRIVGFLADANRSKNFDLFILDTESLEVRSTNLKSRLSSVSEFNKK